jgi:uncharacterized protein YndB with AHSA1/START domain
MERTITLAADVAAPAERVAEILTTTEGQRGFWTADCEVTPQRARFGFPEAPADLEAEVTTEPGRLVRMRVVSGFAFWAGSTWEWELRPPTFADEGTGVLFRHGGFAPDVPEVLLGHVAQTWAMILDRLVRFVADGRPQPYFPAVAA